MSIVLFLYLIWPTQFLEPPLNIKSQLNINIDSNTNVKQILNIETCLIEAQVEPMANKALVKGMLGLKVVYIDMDNMFNTVSDTVNFSETLNSELISTNSKININNSHFIADGDADSKMIRVNIDGYVELFCNINNSKWLLLWIDFSWRISIDSGRINNSFVLLST